MAKRRRMLWLRRPEHCLLCSREPMRGRLRRCDLPPGRARFDGVLVYPLCEECEQEWGNEPWLKELAIESFAFWAGCDWRGRCDERDACIRYCGQDDWGRDYFVLYRSAAEKLPQELKDFLFSLE
jgi:hypothetical protein